MVEVSGLHVKMTGDGASLEKSLDGVQGELRQTSTAAKQTKTQLRGLGVGMQRASAISKKTRSSYTGLSGAVRNTSFQLADFAVMVDGGMGASRALSTQLPQLLGGFGLLGVALSAVVAMGFPLAKVFQNAAKDGKDLTTVFGTLQPLMASLADSMRTVGDMSIKLAELMINNLDRILITAGGLAAFFATKFIVGFVAARVATMSLAGALAFLRGAIMRTGIGALVIAIGEVAYQFTRLVTAAGGVGEAFGLIKDVGVESFGKVMAQMGLLKVKFQLVVNDLQVVWVNALGALRLKFAEFVDSVADTNLGASLGVFGGNVERANRSIALSMGEINDELEGILANQEKYQNVLDAPFESIKKIRELIQSMKDENVTLDSIFGGGDDEDDEDKLGNKLEGERKRIQEHFERVKELTTGSLSDQSGAYGDYFSNLVNLTGSGNKKLLAIGKAFQASQSLIDAYGAYTKVLNDPTLIGRPFLRVAAAAQVLAAGLGAVNAIKSVSSSGGGGGGGGAGAASGAAGQGSRPMEARISGLDPNSLFTGASITSLFDALQDEAGDRGLSVSFG